MNTQSRYKPKYKICSQANENIWGSTKVLKFNSAKWKTLKNNHEKQNSRDFFHDSIKVNTFARPLKQNFKNNLVAKQRLKRYYGKLPEYQFHKLIKQALKTFKHSLVLYAVYMSLLHHQVFVICHIIL